jgi:quercetin dioxygenase-like cupin family protein
MEFIMDSNKRKAVSNKQIDNTRTIVTEWRFTPQAETGWHTHEYDYIIIPMISGYLTLETEEGDRIIEVKEGQSYFRHAGVEHNVINANNFHFSFVEIEVK